MTKFFKLALACLFIGLNVSAQKTILHCGKLIDVAKGETLSSYSIIIEGNKIVEVKAGYVSAAANDKVIDLKNRTVMPGLMDCHVHLEEKTNPNRYLQDFTWNPADYAFQSVGFAEKTLMSGFTTVRHLWGSGVNISLRSALNTK